MHRFGGKQQSFLKFVNSSLHIADEAPTTATRPHLSRECLVAVVAFASLNPCQNS